MNIKEKVYQALMSSPELKALLVKDRKGRCIYLGVSPHAVSYPILVYNVISDVLALVADGEEMERRVTVRIHILTKDGHYSPIYSALQKVISAWASCGARQWIWSRTACLFYVLTTKSERGLISNGKTGKQSGKRTVYQYPETSCGEVAHGHSGRHGNL